MHKLAQNIFLCEAAYAPSVWKPRHISCDLSIHERHPRLNRGSHGDAVATLQKIVGQPRGLVKIEDALKCRTAAARLKGTRVDDPATGRRSEQPVACFER